ncbi:terminase small subunit [Rahnella aceris]|uniref:terminase small subunit n=1 Tax=Rahnella sp. (strain Y9602) TaxID=2703885 RepID=UPI0019040CC7|nr:terminase small subunit [Rahnella aceris]QQN36622.1 terminase small subunit [Rahnella aceris]
MSKPDWKGLQSQFAAAHASTGIKLEDWCEQQGLNYNTARRYIKKPAQKKTAQKPAQKSQKAAPAQGKPATKTAQKSVMQDPERSAYCAELSEQESLLVMYYLESRNKYDAYKKALYTGSDRNARMLFRKVSIARAINRGIEQLQQGVILSAQEILRHWHEIAIADPGEISQMRRCCCRHCWGENFFYQWRDVEEYDKAAAKAAADGRKEPEYGGLGFMPNDDPNPDCPRCAGEGIEDVFLSDTRDVTGPARRLIAGVKKTKFGIEIIQRDQDAALKNLAAFHNLAASEQDKELRLLEIERVRLSNEKIQAEIENLKKGPGKSGEMVVIHGALKVPGAEPSDEQRDD